MYNIVELLIGQKGGVCVCVCVCNLYVVLIVFWMTEINFRIAVLTVRLPSCCRYFIRTLTLCHGVTGLAAGIQAGRIWSLPCIHPRHRSALRLGAKTLQHRQ